MKSNSSSAKSSPVYTRPSWSGWGIGISRDAVGSVDTAVDALAKVRPSASEDPNIRSTVGRIALPCTRRRRIALSSSMKWSAANANAVFVAIVAVLAFGQAPDADAASRCKSFRAGNGVGVVNLRASGTGCVTARTVARRFLEGGSGYVLDQRANGWRCRIVNVPDSDGRATCKRKTARITFGARS